MFSKFPIYLKLIPALIILYPEETATSSKKSPLPHSIYFLKTYFIEKLRRLIS